MSKTFTKADVATHKDEAAGMYIIIDDGVYNITGTSSPPPPPPSPPPRQALTTRSRRLPRRTPRRRQDPQARRRQGRHQAVLEVPRQVGAGKVRCQPQGRNGGRDGEALKWGTSFVYILRQGVGGGGGLIPSSSSERTAGRPDGTETDACCFTGPYLHFECVCVCVLFRIPYARTWVVIFVKLLEGCHRGTG